MIRTSKNCRIHIIAKQLRYRDCENVLNYAYIESDPVVESCINISFAPYNTLLPSQMELFKSASFNESKKVYNRKPKHIKEYK